jgi:hypothetical protein
MCYDQVTSVLVLKDNTLYGKLVLKHSTCEVPWLRCFCGKVVVVGAGMKQVELLGVIIGVYRISNGGYVCGGWTLHQRSPLQVLGCH